jgi:hypothetical protein
MTYCVYCARPHRSLLEPDGGDGCDPYAQPDLSTLPPEVQARALKKVRKPRKRVA